MNEFRIFTEGGSTVLLPTGVAVRDWEVDLSLPLLGNEPDPASVRVEYTPMPAHVEEASALPMLAARDFSGMMYKLPVTETRLNDNDGLWHVIARLPVYLPAAVRPVEQPSKEPALRMQHYRDMGAPQPPEKVTASAFAARAEPGFDPSRQVRSRTGVMLASAYAVQRDDVVFVLLFDYNRKEATIPIDQPTPRLPQRFRALRDLIAQTEMFVNVAFADGVRACMRRVLANAAEQPHFSVLVALVRPNQLEIATYGHMVVRMATADLDADAPAQLHIQRLVDSYNWTEEKGEINSEAKTAQAERAVGGGVDANTEAWTRGAQAQSLLLLRNTTDETFYEATYRLEPADRRIYFYNEGFAVNAAPVAELAIMPGLQSTAVMAFPDEAIKGMFMSAIGGCNELAAEARGAFNVSELYVLAARARGLDRGQMREIGAPDETAYVNEQGKLGDFFKFDPIALNMAMAIVVLSSTGESAAEEAADVGDSDPAPPQLLAMPPPPAVPDKPAAPTRPTPAAPVYSVPIPAPAAAAHRGEAAIGAFSADGSR